MNTRTIIMIVVLVAAAVAGLYALGVNQQADNNTTTTTTISTATPTTGEAAQIEVRIQDSKFVPEEVRVLVGDTVVWINEDSSQRVVASDPHPQHTNLPGLESDPLGQGQSYSFRLTKTGTFGYHDHLNPTIKGSIIVE